VLEANIVHVSRVPVTNNWTTHANTRAALIGLGADRAVITYCAIVIRSILTVSVYILIADIFRT
jgi:hypothetical protein